MMMSLLKRREGGKDMSLGETRGRRSYMAGGEDRRRENGGKKEKKEKAVKKGKTGNTGGKGSAVLASCAHPLIEDLGRENERLRAHLKKDQVYLEQLIFYGLELSDKLLEERANHAREVAALKEAHLAEMKEAYCRMPAQAVPKRAGEGLTPSSSPEKRVCLSHDASGFSHTEVHTASTTARFGVWVDEGDAPSIKSPDEVAPGLRPEIESWVETWRNNAIGTNTLKGKSRDEARALPSKNCVAQRSKGARSDEFCLAGILPSVNKIELSTAMRKKYGKAAATGEPSPSDAAGNDGVGTRLSTGNVAGT
ncbi:hypothetical protein D0868_10264 [Hortaea werneckii]|uniref:Uncharacterized protein n=1 Tax=Hortaea werneckii TaxID=91943 RepID=A0A3M6Y514_HORWE|nr:hypothetical protein D0868_10264 [Hortaea werneckii]